MGFGKQTAPCSGCPGERPLEMTEELALEQSLRQGRAVDGQEGPPQRLLDRVERPGHRGLARTRFANEENGRCGVGDSSDEVEHLGHRGACGDKAAHRSLAERRPQRACLHAEASLVERASEKERQLVDRERLGQVVVRPFRMASIAVSTAA